MSGIAAKDQAKLFTKTQAVEVPNIPICDIKCMSNIGTSCSHINGVKGAAVC